MQTKKGGLKGVWCSVTEGLHTILLQNDVLTVTSLHTHCSHDQATNILGYLGTR